MSDYQKLISDQINEFETPPVFDLMDEQELKDYFHKMEIIGYKINVYGPERCSKFRGFADEALAEMKKRKPGGYK